MCHLNRFTVRQETRTTSMATTTKNAATQVAGVARSAESRIGEKDAEAGNVVEGAVVEVKLPKVRGEGALAGVWERINPPG